MGLHDQHKLNEESLLTLIRRELPIEDPSVIVGSGDDCAIVNPPPDGKALVLKTDAIIEGIHFTAEENLLDVGWKALCRPISDFAAMGAIPQHALITVAAPSSWQTNEWLQLAQGIGKAARAFHITIAGGEIARSPGPLFISVALTGTAAPQKTLRSSAQSGDFICVTGHLGGSLKSRRHLTFTPRLQEGQWLATQSAVHAMMDLSDGLGSDLPRLAKASHCAFQTDPAKFPCHSGCTPIQAISDGEDYELLFTVDPKKWVALKTAWEKEFPNLTLTVIGTMTPGDQPSSLLPQGFDHFKR